MGRVLLCVFLCLLVESVAAQKARVSVEAIRVGRTAEKSRVVFDLSGPIQYQISELSSPSRYVVDFQGLDYALQTENEIFEKTPVSSMHVASDGQGGYSISFDLVADNIEVRSFPLAPFQGRGNRLVLDFYATEQPLEEGHDTQVSPDNVETIQAPTSASAVLATPVPIEVQEPGTLGQRSRLVKEPSGSNVGISTSFSGTWEHEWAYSDSAIGNQKFESLIEPRWDTQVYNLLRLTTIMRLRLDAIGELGPDEQRPNNYSGVNGPWYNDKYSELSLRELYFDFSLGDFYWRLGKQQVVWGQADGIKVLDVVNPQSFREFILDDFDDSRIPLWMANLEYSLGEASSLQLLWIPDTSYHEFAELGSPYFITSSRLVPNISHAMVASVLKPNKPDRALADSDTGLRFTTFIGGWDLSLNYLHHYLDTPVYYQDVQADGKISIFPAYERSNLFGGTLSNAFGDVTLRGELAYNSDTFHTSTDLPNRGIVNSAEYSSVLGLDWQASSDTLISAQWFYSQLLDYQESVIREEREQMASLMLLSDFNNASWQLRVLTLYSIEDGDSLVQVQLKYWMRSNLEIWLGADVFSGDSHGLFGQFDEQDRLLFGFRYGF